MSDEHDRYDNTGFLYRYSLLNDDRWITLYSKDKNPILKVRLTEEGYKRYKEGEKWDSLWVDIILDINRIKLAEF